MYCLARCNYLPLLMILSVRQIGYQMLVLTLTKQNNVIVILHTVSSQNTFFLINIEPNELENHITTRLNISVKLTL